MRDEQGRADKKLLLYKVLDPTTGLAALPTLEGVELYPNPAHTNMQITMPKAGAFAYQLFDATGRRLSAGQGDGQTAIDVERLPAGHYFIEIQSDQGRAVLPFQKR
ncbi:MAG: T9SS type A sorting domain-containing protein [Phaeodactylibacter sp.]|nr:T9SS type A sorting domain-containing protein [Phaeodactylibacter sp.]